MKKFTILLLVTAIMLMGLPLAVSAQAEAEEQTKVITEAEVNESFRATNPIRRGVTNTSVDIQEGQAVISYTLTRRAGSADVTATYTATAVDGDIVWTLIDLDINGAGANESAVERINQSLAAALWRTVKAQYQFFTVTDVTLGGDAITITYIRNF